MNNEPKKILVIDKDEEIFIKIKKILEKETFSCEQATTLYEADEQLKKMNFQLIIANLFLPDSDGFDTLAFLQKKAPSVPIVILGKASEEVIGEEAIRKGAQDFILKSELHPKLLLRMIHYAIDRNGLIEGLRSLSFTDELTGVYNRRGFFVFLEQQLALSYRLKKGFYLFFIDLDYLKEINDTLGHQMGDRALIEAADCIRESFRLYDVVGRLGGDEFAVIAINTPKSTEDHLRRHLIDKIAQCNSKKKEYPYVLSLSVGATYFDPNETITVEALIKRADDNLYKEKKSKVRK